MGQEQSELTYAQALAAVATTRMKWFTANTHTESPPYPNFVDVLPAATQVKLIMANNILANIGAFDGLPVDQKIRYSRLKSQALLMIQQHFNLRILSDHAPLVADYIDLLQGGKRLPFADQSQRFFDGLIECILTEAQMVLTKQYFYGLKLNDAGISTAQFDAFKRGQWKQLILDAETLEPISEPHQVNPDELDEFVLSGLNAISLNELHARIFLDHYTTTIRAQWDKTVELAQTVVKAKNGDSVGDRLKYLKHRVRDSSVPLSNDGRDYFQIFTEIATERLKTGGWLKNYRDSLLHKIGPRSSGLLPHRKSLNNTTDAWNNAQEEHNHLQEAIVALLIALILS